MPKSGLNVALKGLDDIFSTEESRQEEQREQVQQIPVSELFPFKNHPFKVLDDDSMTRTVESISQFGVLAPLIARPRPEGGYEIISGHRRKHAAELANLDTVPVIVRNMEDDAATILMVDSNLQREHILPSERAFAYKMKLDAIKNQGARSDLTSSQVGTKLRADEKVAKDSGESRNQVQRFVRLTNLVPELLDMVDEKKISFNPAVELSYLDEKQQQDFLEAMDASQNAPSLSQAIRIKKLAQQGEFDYDAVYNIMNIPFGKLTIIQGNPGEGKTYFAMRLAAACTNRKPLPGMETLEPFNIIYQTAEDGLGDTVKPRLMEAEADLERVLVIDDRDTPLTLADERIARAIRENNARLVIIDPVQAFLGADVDMNRANEVRPIFRSLGDIAQATGCAIVLIGHLNKAAGTQSTYRGLGSIDITAAVRSLLFIGKLKDSPTMRALIHEKSSLAPPGQSLAFSLGDEKGFEWIGAYDITADELLAGTDTAKTESKTAQAQMLILELLADGKRMPSAELEKAVNERGISSRTMRTAKSRIGDRLVTEKDGTAWVCYLRD